MSYDLYFYKRRGASISDGEIEEYLTENQFSKPEKLENAQIFENPDTGVYYAMEKQADETLR